MEEIMWAGPAPRTKDLSRAQTVWTLSDGSLDSEVNNHIWGNEFNKFVIVTDLEWNQTGGEANRIGYRLTLTVGDII
jgi:hypothetical protein